MKDFLEPDFESINAVRVGETHMARLNRMQRSLGLPESSTAPEAVASLAPYGLEMRLAHVGFGLMPYLKGEPR